MSPYVVPLDAFHDYEDCARTLYEAWKQDGRIAEWLFKACMCGEDTPVDPVANTTTGELEGVRSCKKCGLRFEIQLGGELDVCGATMTMPYGLWLHRQRHSWALQRWLMADPDRKLSLRPKATRHRYAMRPSVDDLSLSWFSYFWHRLVVDTVRSPRKNFQRFRERAKQLSSPILVLAVLQKEVLKGGRYWRDGKWQLAVTDEPEGKIRTVRVHWMSGLWSLEIQDPQRAEETAPWPPVSYRASFGAEDDVLNLVRLLVGLEDRSQARGWLRDHGYSPPEKIGLQQPPRAEQAA